MFVYVFHAFFCNAPATTEIYTDGHTLSLHDALPIWSSSTATARRRHRSPPAPVPTSTPSRWPLSSASKCSPTAPRRSTAPTRSAARSEEHTSELQSLMRISYAVFCLKKKKHTETSSRYQTRSRTEE